MHDFDYFGGQLVSAKFEMIDATIAHCVAPTLSLGSD